MTVFLSFVFFICKLLTMASCTYLVAITLAWTDISTIYGSLTQVILFIFAHFFYSLY